LIISIITKDIYKGKLDKNVCDQSKNWILEKQEKFSDNSWQCKIRTSYSLVSNILNAPELRELKFHVLSNIENYMHEINNFIDGYIKNSWVNIYEKEFYQEFHTHKSFTEKNLSGVLYLTNNNSEIEFEVNQRTIIKPEYGDILIFADDIPHRVLANQNDDLRISLAFNYKLCQQSKDIFNF